MPDRLEELLLRAKHSRQSEQDWEDQRRSFAFGNASIENDLITRELVDAEAEALGKKNLQFGPSLNYT